MQKNHWFPAFLGNVLNKNRTMKLSFLLFALVLFNLHANTYGQHKKLSLNITDKSIESVLEEIESESKFNFFYKTEEIDVKRKVTIKVLDTSIKKILILLFKDQNVSYKVVKKQIVLKRNGIVPSQSRGDKVEIQNKPIFQYSVTGTITDYNGTPLPGANIIEKGTTNGVTADFDGNFSLEVADENATLVVSYLGFSTMEVAVNGQSTIDITLEESAENLDEIVLTALGLEKKKDEDISSSTTVNTEALQRSGESGVVQGMAGKTSGVLISRNSGDPGSGAYIQIRGQNTILGDSSPLIILDGIQISNTTSGAISNGSGVDQQSRLNDINPNDIENMTILKGAAAAAIYGTGAANGVIVIKTKRGRVSGPNKIRVDIRSTVGIDKVSVEYEKQGKFGQGIDGTFLADTGTSWGDKISERAGGTDDFLMGNERFVSESGNVYYPILKKKSREVFNRTNRNQIFQTGFTLDNSINVSIGSNKGNSFLSFSDWNQIGVFRETSDYRRQTLRFNNETDWTDNIKFKFITSYTKSKSNRIQKGNNANGVYLGYLRGSPDFDNRDYIGTYYNENNASFLNSHRGYRSYLGNGTPAYNNPGWTLYEQENPNNVERFIIAPELVWSITDKMNFTARYGLDYYTDIRETFFPVNSSGASSSGRFNRNEIIEKTQTTNFFLQSSDQLGEKFNLSWILGASLEENSRSNIGGTSNQFTNPFVGELRIFGNASAENELPNLNKFKTRKAGAYGVLNLDLFNQLLIELTGRYERPSTLNNNILALV